MSLSLTDEQESAINKMLKYNWRSAKKKPNAIRCGTCKNYGTTDLRYSCVRHNCSTAPGNVCDVWEHRANFKEEK